MIDTAQQIEEIFLWYPKCSRRLALWVTPITWTILQIVGERGVFARSEPKTAFNGIRNARIGCPGESSSGGGLSESHPVSRDNILAFFACETICGCQPGLY